MQKKWLGLGLFGLSTLLLAATASAQSGEGTLLFDSTRDIHPDEARSISLGARFFSDDSPTTYGNFAYTWGAGDRSDWQIRFTGGEFDQFSDGGPVILTGGTDFEFRMRAKVVSIDGLLFHLGLSIPDTRANRIPAAIAGLTYERAISDSSSFYLGTMAYGGTVQTLWGVGAGFSTRIGSNLTLGVDGMTMIEGENSFDTSTGTSERETIYGVVLRYRQNDRITYEFVATNSLGRTTAFAMTPMLGDTPGFGFGVKVRF